MISTGGHLTILESVDSTNNYAMARVRTGLASHGDGFFAMAQTAGKGQRGKAWITEPGTNIIITLVMRPDGLQLQQQFQLTTAVALAVYDFYTYYAGKETAIKWPNDIYWRDRKAGGILIENIIGGGVPSSVSRESSVDTGYPDSETSKKRVETYRSDTTFEAAPKFTQDRNLTNHWQWAVIGMGVNINQTAFSEDAPNAVSLKQITGKDWDIIALAKDLCGYIQNRYAQLMTRADLLPEYNLRMYKKGQIVKFKKDSRLFEGRVKEVNRLGELVVVTALEEHFCFGEIEWIL